MKQRSVGIAILLSIITCGIYGIYWLIMLNDETNYVSGHQQDGTSGGVVFLLTLVTCGIYGYYWCYKQGESSMKQRCREVLWLIQVLRYFILYFQSLVLALFLMLLCRVSLTRCFLHSNQ